MIVALITTVHCMLGQSRSAAAVAAYLMHARGMGRDEAVSFVRRQRPIVRLDPTLLKLLADWEQVLHARK